MMYNSTGNVGGHVSSPGSSGGAITPRSGGGIHYPLQPHQVYQPVMVPLPPPTSQMFYSASRSGDDDTDFPIRDERFPEWGNQEIMDFIEIRAQLEWNFSGGDRNKDLWETVANKMRERGYLRTSDQCKWKWKVLKGQEVSNLDDGQQSLFFDEMHAISSARANRMPQQLAIESEMGLLRGKKRAKRVTRDQLTEECSEEKEDTAVAEVEIAPKRKLRKEKQPKSAENGSYLTPTPSKTSNDGGFINSIKEIMRSFIQQQQNIDMQWRKRMEKQAEERDLFEQEWRQKMENLEKEKLIMEQTQSEREEQRRLREDVRAEKRDALLTALLNKLIQDETS